MSLIESVSDWLLQNNVLWWKWRGVVVVGIVCKRRGWGKKWLVCVGRVGIENFMCEWR